MAFNKYLENLTRYFAKLYKDPEQRNTARKKLEVFLNGIKTADSGLIAYKDILSHIYASDFTDACSHFLSQVVWLHSSAQIEEHRYKQQVLEVSCSAGGCGGVRGHVRWMSGSRDGGGRGGRDRRCGRVGGQSHTTINGVDVSYPTCNFTDN